MLLNWLASYPGEIWQERWLASGADTAGQNWRAIPARWLRDQGWPCANAALDRLCAAVPVLIGADVLRPGIIWLVRATSRGGALARTEALTRDVEGFAPLHPAGGEDAHLPAAAAPHSRHRAAILLGANGVGIDEITVGDIVHLLEVEADAHQQPMATTSRSTPPCTGWVSCARTRPRPCEEARGGGQRFGEQLIDRHHLTCRPLNLLVDYLRERPPALGYSSLRSRAATLGNVF